MSRDLRLEELALTDSQEQLVRKLQANVEKTQLILDSLSGVTNASWAPIRVVTGQPTKVGDSVQVGDGFFRWNVDGWLEYKQGSEWLKLPRGPAKEGYTPVWLTALGGPYWIPSSGIQPWVEVSDDYTVLTSDCVVRCDATVGAFTVYMPAPETAPGKVYYVKKIDPTAYKVTISSSPYEIDGDTSRLLTIPFQCVALHSIGTTWELLGGFP